jgi:hypothetical protein
MREGPDGLFHTQHKSGEGSATALYTLGKSLKQMREKMRLPPGCMLQ